MLFGVLLLGLSSEELLVAVGSCSSVTTVDVVLSVMHRVISYLVSNRKLPTSHNRCDTEEFNAINQLDSSK